MGSLVDGQQKAVIEDGEGQFESCDDAVYCFEFWRLHAKAPPPSKKEKKKARERPRIGAYLYILVSAKYVVQRPASGRRVVRWLQ